MNGAYAFLVGFEWKNIKPALYGWFFNLLFSIAIYLGVYIFFYNAAGSSALAAGVTTQIGLFTFVNDILANYPGSLPFLVLIGAISVVLYFLFSIFASGGIIAALLENEKTTFPALVSSSGEHFTGMLKVFFFNAVILCLSLLVPGVLALATMSLNYSSDGGKIIDILFYTSAALAIFIIVLSTVIYDYTRIYKIKEERNLYETIKNAFSFIFSNKWNIMVLLVLYLLSMLILYLGFSIIRNRIENLLNVALLFVIYQVFIMARYYLKVVIIRAEVFLIEKKEIEKDEIEEYEIEKDEIEKKEVNP
jgi:hypothetical protein